jgi:hypothetical protein
MKIDNPRQTKNVEFQSNATILVSTVTYGHTQAKPIVGRPCFYFVNDDAGFGEKDDPS